MPEQRAFPEALRACYRDYEARVEEAARRARPGEGIFGFRGGVKDDPCHTRFAEELRKLLADYAASRPDPDEACELLLFMAEEPLRYRGERSAAWMLLAVQGLAMDLTPMLRPDAAAALAAAYEKDYPRSKRLPVQNELLKRLKQRAKD